MDFREKVEEDKAANKFYVFVNIPNDLNSLPEYYIVKVADLSKNIYEGHRNWLKEPGKNGRIRKDSSARQFDPRYFSCLLYTSPSPRDATLSRMPSSA